eukprot:4514139-Pleurochrysis_carterae.AAC.1
MTSILRKLSDSTKTYQTKNVHNGYRDKSRSPSSCELKYRDRLAHEIPLLIDSYLEPTPVLVER